jgi:predicted aldo/keto reductase-like oxidoreductase
MEELEQFIQLDADPPALDENMLARIDEDRASLSGAFCRGCGYCLPCPADIPIHIANRMTQLLARSPAANWLTGEWQLKMQQVPQCQKCGLCAARCPFELRPQDTLQGHYEFYRQYIAENT